MKKFLLLIPFGSGKGTFKFSSGKVLNGNFFDGLPHGPIQLTTLSGDKYKSIFEYGAPGKNVDVSYSNGDTYSGEWKDGKPHGSGTFKDV